MKIKYYKKLQNNKYAMENPENNGTQFKYNQIKKEQLRQLIKKLLRVMLRV
jgi:hypothetical protein